MLLSFLHYNSESDCDDRSEDPDQGFDDEPLNFDNLFTGITKSYQRGPCKPTKHNLGA